MKLILIDSLRLLQVALQFLTPIPLKSSEVRPEDLARSMRFFPLIGFMIGVFLVLLKTASLSLGFSIWITATLLLLALTTVSGALHMDGLADMCDGFYGGRTKEEILKIMRDAHLGVMGVIGIVFILLIKWSILASFPLGNASYSNVSLILLPLISRWSMVIAASLGSYAQVAQDGIGKPFTEHITRKEVVIATVITLVIILVASILSSDFIRLLILGFLLLIASLIPVVAMVLISRKMLGGITGDILGAINEVTEMTVLFGAYLIYLVI